MDAVNLLQYPLKRAKPIENIFSLIFLSAAVIYLTKLAGLIGLAILYLSVFLKFMLKNNIKDK